MKDLEGRLDRALREGDRADGIAKLREDAGKVVDQHAATAQAFADEHAAAVVLLDAAVEAVRPALAIICSRTLRRVSHGGCASHGIPANTSELHVDLRGVVLTPGPKGIMLSEDGVWFVDVAEPCRDDRCTRWHWIPVDRVMLAERFPVEKLVVSLHRALQAQLEGNKDLKAAEANVRARRLQMAADLLRKAG